MENKVYDRFIFILSCFIHPRFCLGTFGSIFKPSYTNWLGCSRSIKNQAWHKVEDAGTPVLSPLWSQFYIAANWEVTEYWRRPSWIRKESSGNISVQIKQRWNHLNILTEPNRWRSQSEDIEAANFVSAIRHFKHVFIDDDSVASQRLNVFHFDSDRSFWRVNEAKQRSTKLFLEWRVEWSDMKIKLCLVMASEGLKFLCNLNQLHPNIIEDFIFIWACILKKSMTMKIKEIIVINQSFMEFTQTKTIGFTCYKLNTQVNCNKQFHLQTSTGFVTRAEKFSCR